MDQPSEFWRSRLKTPSYRIRDAADYANLSSQTVTNWHCKPGSNRRSTLSVKERGSSLSYLQLIEVAVVASFRKAGVPLKNIRSARDFMQDKLGAEFPFAEYRFKTEGRELWLDYAQFDPKADDTTLMVVSKGGQFGWSSIIGRLKEFDYETDGLAIRWHLMGRKNNLIIDPRIQFGAPSVHGVSTSVIKGRWECGETLSDLAYDYAISEADVELALDFEGYDHAARRATRH